MLSIRDNTPLEIQSKIQEQIALADRLKNDQIFELRIEPSADLLLKSNDQQIGLLQDVTSEWTRILSDHTKAVQSLKSRFALLEHEIQQLIDEEKIDINQTLSQTIISCGKDSYIVLAIEEAEIQSRDVSAGLQTLEDLRCRATDLELRWLGLRCKIESEEPEDLAPEV